jgi:uncharacterized protein (DUF433 family)
MVTKDTETSFEGIYVAPEASLYLTATLKRDVPTRHQVYPVSSRNLIRWIRVGLASPEIKHVPGKELLITFEDLVSMRVIAVLRSLGVTWPKIHRAEQWMREKTGYRRPFAIERVWTETEDVFAEFPEGFIAASRRGQLAFVELFGQHLQPVEDMTFVRLNGVRVAATWTPHENVMMNPRVQFGEPCVIGTRLRTRALWLMWNGGDSIDYLAKAFNLTVQIIKNSLEWEHRLRAVQTS